MGRLRLISDHVKEAVGKNPVSLPYGEVRKLWVAKSMGEWEIFYWIANIMRHLLLGTHYFIYILEKSEV
jgi:hypothetical protein